MPDELDVTGGTSAFATEDLSIAADQLKRLGLEAGAIASDLARIDSPPTPGIYNSGQAQLDVDHAVRMLEGVSHRAAALDSALTFAAQGYIVAERTVESGLSVLRTLGAQWLGLHLPARLGMAGLAAASPIGLGLGAILLAGLGSRLSSKGGSFIRTTNQLVNNEHSVAITRMVTQALGPMFLGTVAAPPGAPLLMGSKPYEFGAKFLVGAGRTFGLFDATPVRLAGSSELPVTEAPQTYEDRLARMPRGEDGAQVMIERYSVPGEPDRFSVYVGGTVTFNPGSTSEPWDMASNMVNATGEVSGSAASVREAMAEAGIDKDSPVQFTGFSQGGGTVARIVSSGEFNTQGVLTFGAPTGQIPLPEGIPTVLVEHADDPVPALGGEQGNTAAVLVRRDVFDRGEEVDSTMLVPSHHWEYYLKTARIMDESGSPQLESTLGKLDSFTAGATLESSTAYHYERVLDD